MSLGATQVPVIGNPSFGRANFGHGTLSGVPHMHRLVTAGRSIPFFLSGPAAFSVGLADPAVLAEELCGVFVHLGGLVMNGGGKVMCRGPARQRILPQVFSYGPQPA
jgi:hypothetical protein